MSDLWNERMRLIRFRRKHERSRFRDELRIIPRWLVWTCITVWLIGGTLGCIGNYYSMTHGGDYSSRRLGWSAGARMPGSGWSNHGGSFCALLLAVHPGLCLSRR